MAEWAKDFAPEMGNLNTKLIIRKIHNREVTTEGVHYKKLFSKYGIDSRLLLKAHPGWGKSSCTKAIAWDWAKGVVTSVSVVFRLTVKFLRPDDSLESIIIEQYAQRGVNINKLTLDDILRDPTYPILVIIDGLEEARCQETVLVNFMENSRNPRCTLFVTLESEVSGEIEKVFPTVCEIQEIAQRDMKSLVSSFTKGDQGKTEMIVNSKVNIPPLLGPAWHSSPMLLMFFSFLIDRKVLGFANEDIDVHMQNYSLCYLYLKLVLVLCKQSVQALCFSVKSFGKIVLDNLQSSLGNPYYERDICVRSKNELVCKFMHEILSASRKRRELFLGPISPVSEVLTAMESSLTHLISIMLINDTELLENNVLRDNTESHLVRMLSHLEILTIVVQNQQVKSLRKIQECVKHSQRKCNVVFIHNYQSKRMIDLSLFAHPSVETLHIHQALMKYHCFMFCKSEIQNCESLTTLTSLGVDIDKSILKYLSKAVETGNLPNVTHLGFNGSNDTKGKLHPLFRCKWEKLAHLDLTKCNLDTNDMEIVCAQITGSSEVLLPALSSLAVSDNCISSSRDQFTKEWLGLTSLERYDIHSDESMFVNALKKKMFPRVENFKISVYGSVQLENLIPRDLKCLSIVKSKTHENSLNLQNLRENISPERLRYLNLSYNVLENNTCKILCHNLPVLETLVLRGCRLNAADVQVLAQADCENSLPQLKHLDIAFNPVNYLRYLFEHGSTWSGLLSLTIDWMRINSEMSMNSLAEAGKSGCLGSLQTLSFFTDGHYLNTRDTCRTCETLKLERDRSSREYVSQGSFLSQ